LATVKARIKHTLPPGALNATLLRFPRLYSTGLVDYETNLRAGRGIEDLLSQMELAVASEGDLIECGSSRCGSTVIMARRLRELGLGRRIFACDSFEGFDRDELAEERAAGMTDTRDNAFTSTSLDYVQRKLRRLQVDDIITPVQGYFEQTLPTLQGPWCFGFIDCDLEQSLRFCADSLWRQLTAGGRLIFDDYTSVEYRGAKRGVDQFIADQAGSVLEHGLLNRLYYAVKK
jgi:hypothetical protein